MSPHATTTADPTDPAPVLTAAKHRARRIFLGAGWSLVSRAIGVAVTVAAVPLAIQTLGSERFGAWITITGTLALLGFVDGGMSNALINLIADRAAHNDESGIKRLVSTAFALLGTLATAGLILTGLATFLVDWEWLFNLSEGIEGTEIRDAIAVALSCFFLNFILGVVQRIRTGLQETHRNEYFEIAGQLCKLLAVTIAAFSGASLPVFVFAFACGQLVSTSVNFVSLFFLERPSLRPNLVHVSTATANLLFRTGLLFLGLQLCAAVAFQTDALIVTRLHGLTAAAELGLALKLFGLSTMLSAVLTAPFWPAFRDACSRQDFVWIRRTFFRALWSCLAGSLVITGAIYIFSDDLLMLWSNSKVIPSPTMTFWVFAWSNMLTVGHVLAVLLNGLQIVRLQLILSATMTICNLALSWLLTTVLGPHGVILGSVISYTLCILIPYAVLLPSMLTGESLAWNRLDPSADPATSRLQESE